MAMKVSTGSIPQDTIKPVQNTKATETVLQDPYANRTNGLDGTDIGKVSSQIQTKNEQETGGQGNPTSEEKIKSAVNRANNRLKAHRTKCEFSYHEETNRVSIKVLDKETKEVIREIPPEETLEMIEKMWELAGLLIDERR